VAASYRKEFEGRQEETGETRVVKTPTENWARIERLFEAAVDLPPAERASFLDAECAGDPPLRRELESLLAADSTDGETIADAVAREAQAFVGSEELAGSRMGTYRIIREIGRGGMGSVYLAIRDDDQYRKEVAIKLIRHGMDTQDVLDRFRRERQILANLDHPYIARLLDAGTALDGRPFFVMEYVTGKTLDAWYRDRADENPTLQDLVPRLELFLRICEAVSYAHRKLVVHRDLKPANIFVTPDGLPKLLDFGVAKLLEPDVDFRLSATNVSARPLTPDYASPEQLRGGQISTSTDVYSLGAILYELLSGVRAHRFISRSTREVERVICDADPQPLSDAAPAMRGKLRGDLEAIVFMAMRKEQDRRYQSIDQMAADIRAYLQGRAVAARQGSFSYRAGKYLRRHRTAIAVSVLFAVALIGGAAVATVQAIRANREQLLAEKERRLAVESQVRAEASRRNAELQAREAESQRHEAELQRSLAETERQVANRHFDQVRQLAGKFLVDFHNAIANLPGSTPARKMVVQTGLEYYDMLVREAGGNREVLEEVARGYVSLGDVQGNPYFANLGDVPGAIASYRRALAIRAGVSDTSAAFQRDRIVSQVKLAQVLVAQGDFKAADEINLAAIDLGEKALREAGAGAGSYEVRRALANAYSTYGDLKIRVGVHRQAVDPYLKLLALATATAQTGLNPQQEQNGVSLAHTKLGDVYYRIDRPQESVEQLLAALEIDKRLAAANPSNIALMRKVYVDYSFLGRVLHTVGGQKLAKPGEVTNYLVAARDLADQMSAVDPNNRTALTDVAMAETGLGDWLRDGKDIDGALAAFAKGITAAERSSRLQPAGTEDLMMQVYHRMATGLFEAHRYDDALENVRLGEGYLQQAEKQNPGLVRNAARKLELYRVRADSHMALKHWEQAAAAWTELIAFAEAQLKLDPANLRFLEEEPDLYAGLANCYAAQGQQALATSTMQSALDRYRTLESRRTLSDEEETRKSGVLSTLATWKTR
jgi:serine/threonine protein kinase